MNKFTVFTVILSVVVIVVVADLVVNNYLPGLKDANIISEITSGKFNLPENIDVSKAIETNVMGATDVNLEDFQTSRLGFDLGTNVYTETKPQEEEPTGTKIPVESFDTTSSSVNLVSEDPEEIIPIADTTEIEPVSGSSDFEDSAFDSFPKNIFLRDEQVKSAGFVSAYMEIEKYDGSLYKTIYTDDLYNVSVEKIVIKSADVMFAKVYVLTFGPKSRLEDVYQVLKTRGSEGLDVEINETNEYGDGSFYMNDTKRPGTAFLTVKLGNLIYGFYYPKEYHPQVKNLIKLLEWEK